MQRSRLDSITLKGIIARPQVGSLAWQGLSELVLVLGAVLIGGIVRASYIVGADFPLNDGGLFYAMVEDLRAAAYRLPAFSSYNGGIVPFVYPPFAFYVTALLADLGLLNPLDSMRMLPLIANLLSIAAVHRLGKVLGLAPVERCFGVLAFALLPSSYQWQIMGGGLTRAPALLFALLLLIQTQLLYTTGRRCHLAWAMFWGTLTVLTHPETALFAVCSAVLFCLATCRSRQALTDSVLVAAGVLVLTSPWWMQVLRYHGAAPLLVGLGTGNHGAVTLVELMLFDYTGEATPGLLTVAGLCGLFIALVDRRMLLPIWVMVIGLLTPRTAHTFAMVPLALLAGICFNRVVLPALARHGEPAHRSQHVPTTERAGGLLLKMLIMLIIGSSALQLSKRIQQQSEPLQSLAAADRTAMAWVAGNTAADATFLVVSGQDWAADEVAEWFPVLSQRVSVATVQGHEWLPRFYDWNTSAEILRRCTAQDLGCLRQWQQLTNLSYGYLYLPKQRNATAADCCGALRLSLRASPRYRVVYDEAGATIFMLRPPTATLLKKAEY